MFLESEVHLNNVGHSSFHKIGFLSWLCCTMGMGCSYDCSDYVASLILSPELWSRSNCWCIFQSHQNAKHFGSFPSPHKILENVSLNVHNVWKVSNSNISSNSYNKTTKQQHCDETYCPDKFRSLSRQKHIVQLM